jgi:hypothetical protein
MRSGLLATVAQETILADVAATCGLLADDGCWGKVLNTLSLYLLSFVEPPPKILSNSTVARIMFFLQRPSICGSPTRGYRLISVARE